MNKQFTSIYLIHSHLHMKRCWVYWSCIIIIIIIVHSAEGTFIYLLYAKNNLAAPTKS